MADPMQSGAPADPSAAPDADAAPDASQGYTIELKVDGQGKMSVCVEPAGEEANEEAGADGGEGAPEDDAQPVGSLREAFKLITEIVAHAGQMSDTGASDAEMSSGYGKAGAQ